MSIFKICVILSFVLSVLLIVHPVESVEYVAFDPDNFIVEFQPYTKHGDDDHADDYTLAELKEMINLTSTRFKTLMTNSMGVVGYSHDWETGLPDALVGKAASELNKEAGILKTSVIIGIQLDPENAEITEAEYKHALSAAADANSRFPGTVTRLSFAMTDSTPEHFNFTRDFLLERQDEVRDKDLKVGLSTAGTCKDVIKHEDAVDILNAVDFILCYEVPNANKFSEKIVNRVGSSWLNLRREIKKINHQVEVIGRTWFTSSNQSDHKNLVQYWLAMNKWGLENHMKVAMYSAFDLPYVVDGGMKEAGWFKRIKNDTTNFDSFVEKARCNDYDCTNFLLPGRTTPGPKRVHGVWRKSGNKRTSSIASLSVYSFATLCITFGLNLVTVSKVI